MKKKLKPISPGEILFSFILEKYNNDFKNLELLLYSLIKNEQEITIEIADKLSKLFNNTPEFWLNIQKNYDDYDNELKEEYNKAIQKYVELENNNDFIQDLGWI